MRFLPIAWILMGLTSADTVSAFFVTQSECPEVSAGFLTPVLNCSGINQLQGRTQCPKIPDTLSMAVGRTLSLSLESVLSGCPPMVSRGSKEKARMGRAWRPTWRGGPATDSTSNFGLRRFVIRYFDPL
jgi:hypothetical protein